MRKRLSELLVSVGVVAGLAAATAWGVFIWRIDWGPFLTRAWVLWAIGLLFGGIIVFAVVASIFGWLSSLLDRT